MDSMIMYAYDDVIFCDELSNNLLVRVNPQGILTTHPVDFDIRFSGAYCNTSLT